MKIGVAQTRPITGDIPGNIHQHRRFIELALSAGADMLIFPELSLTGYEPTLAKQLAIDKDDNSLDTFQQISDAHGLTIGAGIPTRQREGVCISMLLFQPDKPRETYSKKYLHTDEEPFFVRGQDAGAIGGDIALAICYEIHVPRHAEDAFKHGATIYLTSVAKFTHGIDKGLARLSHIGSSYGMTVLMANSVGPADGLVCAGKSSIWNNKGLLLGQLDDSQEGILIIDTDNQEVTVIEKFFGQV